MKRPLQQLGVAITLLIGLSMAMGVARTHGHECERVSLNVGFGRTSFLTVNIADAKAAFKVFAESVGKKKGYDLDVMVQAFESDEALAAAVTNNTFQLVIMVSWDYLNAGLEKHLEPRFVPSKGNKGLQEYVLLVVSDGPYQHVRDLGGKAIILLENTNCEMSLNWLETLLLEEGLGTPDEFFSCASMEKKPAKAVLPVFFGKTDACIVNAPVFETMKELNPQVGRRLRAIAVSEPLLDGATYLSRKGWKKSKYREDMIKALETLHEDPQGQQILTLFKADRLVPFEEALMSGTKALKEKYDRLVREVPKP